MRLRTETLIGIGGSLTVEEQRERTTVGVRMMDDSGATTFVLLDSYQYAELRNMLDYRFNPAEMSQVTLVADDKL